MGLVDEYGSDSEEENPPQSPHPHALASAPKPDSPPIVGSLPKESQPLPPSSNATNATKDDTAYSTLLCPTLPPSEPAATDAPIVGPLRPPSVSPSPEPEEDQGPPFSPYSASRSLIHSLTLPTSIPLIPPSPTGSPPPSLVGKFSHFRDLKTEGVHFNEKLLRSSSLRNPNLLQKLTAFVRLENMDQYATNLTSELWDPTGFNKEAFVEVLAANHTRIAEARERAKIEQAREKVEFVGSVQAQASPARAQPRERMEESVAERVMNGLDRERKVALPRRDRDEGWGGRRDDRDRRRDEDHRDRRRDDDREPKRRWTRSRSRERDRGGRKYNDVEYRDRR
ncbi:hypothetical protein K440DRAFT_297556 [Wilcoxina mikolae CBS 423.85]|nr:hypothetical protein K440DRAFT_297556 [Wilcoxina mikolae CBS 423.85]